MDTEIHNRLKEIEMVLKQQAKSIKVINREMGETRDEMQGIRVDYIKSQAKLKEDLICEINKERDHTIKEISKINEEIGVIKERLKSLGNGRQWFEKILIFVLGVCLTIIGFLLK